MNDINNFPRIALALFIVSTLTISAAIAIDTGWEGSFDQAKYIEDQNNALGNGIEFGISNDGMTEAEKLSARFNTPDPFGENIQPGTSSATDKMLKKQGMDPIFESVSGDIYSREVHGITIYSPDGNSFPIGYSSDYKNYFFYGSVDDFQMYIAGNAWYKQVMYLYLLTRAEDIPKESNTRFAYDSTDNFTNSSQIYNKDYGGGYGNWLFALN